MKKIKIFVLVAALLVCTLFTSCTRKAGEESKGLAFTLNESGTAYTVTGIGKCKDKDVLIPKEYKDLPVTAIGEYAFRGTDIVKMTVTENVVSIAHNAFEDCAALVYNTYETVNYVGTEQNPYYAAVFAPENSKESFVLHADTKIIADYAFGDCSIKNISVPKGVTHIGANAFYSCGALTEITLPETLTHIGAEAFGNCGSLKEITLPKSLSFMGDSVFLYCMKVEKITFGGTRAEWNAVSKDGWDSYFGADYEFVCND
ncbi:MAG: leucine-rich repeat domain-containing protein [Clostridia bacterium]|nr:leucine-rich repeat domain-containing protein [Clostridia bacterium]